MTETAVRNVIIIGSGPAGLTASIYAARANMKPLLIEGFSAGGLIPGGQLMFTTDVENYPGFPEKVTGQELMQRFRDQAEHQGTEIVTADVTKVDFSQRPFKVWVEDTLYLAKTVIVATGARANYVGLEGGSERGPRRREREEGGLAALGGAVANLDADAHTSCPRRAARSASLGDGGDGCAGKAGPFASCGWPAAWRRSAGGSAEDPSTGGAGRARLPPMGAISAARWG